jgi:hypothetical protein
LTDEMIVRAEKNLSRDKKNKDLKNNIGKGSGPFKSRAGCLGRRPIVNGEERRQGGF